MSIKFADLNLDKNILSAVRSEGYESKTHKTEAQAFSDTTDDKGEVSIIPLRQGFWKASVEHKADFPDQSVCQKQANYTTLTFQIGHSHH